MKMMLQHGMLDENDEIRCKAMIEENERKLDKFNITPCSKMEADRVKWAEFVELYAIRLRAEDDLAGRVKLLRETNPKVKFGSLKARLTVEFISVHTAQSHCRKSNCQCGRGRF